MNFEDFLNTHFYTPDSAPVWQQRFEQALNLVFSAISQHPDTKIGSDVSLPSLEKIFAETNIPSSALTYDEVFQEAIKSIVAHSVKVSDARFVGHMTSVTPVVNQIIDLIISALNQNVVKIETALSASFVEKQTICWLHRLIYARSENYYTNHMHAFSKTLGNITNGGTAGNITALTVARNLLLPNAASEGLTAALLDKGMQRLVILASSRVHYSIKKVASLLGIGSQNVLQIPVHPFTNQISLEALTTMLQSLEKHKIGVLAIVGVAGTTETGNVDNLAALAQIANNYGIWFHVDAAWGGALLMSDTHKQRLAGIEKADSVVMDGHKLFYVNLNHGAVLFRNESSLDAIRHSAKYIIRPGSVDLGKTSIEGSRRFDSFKFWFLLKTLGRSGYATLINNAVNLAKTFAKKIEAHPCFELTSLQETNIVTYRYMPPEWKTILENHDNNIDIVKFSTDFLNEVNIELQKQQRENGNTFVSRTALESVYSGFEIVVLRAVFMNPFTTEQILTNVLLEQQELGSNIAKALWPKYQHKAPNVLKPAQ